MSDVRVLTKEKGIIYPKKVYEAFHEFRNILDEAGISWWLEDDPETIFYFQVWFDKDEYIENVKNGDYSVEDFEEPNIYNDLDPKEFLEDYKILREMEEL